MSVSKAQQEIKVLNSKGVDGIIAIVASYDQALVETMCDSAAPVVALGQDLSLYGIHSVLYDDYRSGFIVGCELLKLGCRKLLFLGVDASDVALGRQRLRGFQDALEPAQVTCRFVTDCELSLDSGREKTSQVLADGFTPDGVFAVTDRIALGAARSLRDAGLQIGRDVALVGVGDEALCQINEPPLASVHYDRINVGFQAGELLLALVAGEEQSQLAFVHQGELVPRASCARA